MFVREHRTHVYWRAFNRFAAWYLRSRVVVLHILEYHPWAGILQPSTSNLTLTRGQVSHEHAVGGYKYNVSACTRTSREDYTITFVGENPFRHLLLMRHSWNRRIIGKTGSGNEVGGCVHMLNALPTHFSLRTISHIRVPVSVSYSCTFVSPAFDIDLRPSDGSGEPLPLLEESSRYHSSARSSFLS